MTESMTADLAYAGFNCVARTKIDSLNVEVQDFIYPDLDSRHIHIAAGHRENVFLVALRTVPQDSRGVAHILEHTALCGSKRFPVRDPFFMMTRRSLNTFMNAFTASDWTAYPFASQNKKDFFNLLDVYLDAVFFANLNELDFAQEGHRLEFAEQDKADSDLVYKGIVYNEMKGAMSSPMSLLWATLTRYLFPTATYHFNSGGDPDHIPDLTYADLKAFYNRHYHPSNALFMTFGNYSAKEIQKEIHNKVLREFPAKAEKAVVHPEKRYFAPLKVAEAYPLAPEEDLSGKTHVVTGWLLGASADSVTNLEAHLLTNVLLENSASPLMQVLETTDLGRSPSGLCGLEDSYHEMVFVCGLEGSDANLVDDVETLILSTLAKVAEEGVDDEKTEAVLHQLELSQREISGDSYPYGLQLILTSMSSVLQGQDAAQSLDISPVIETLRERIKNPDYIKQLIRRLLLDNPHRVTLNLAPDCNLEANRERYNKQLLAAIKNSLSESQKLEIIERSKALQARQNQQDSEEILPRVGLSDVPDELPIAAAADASEIQSEHSDTSTGLAVERGKVWLQEGRLTCFAQGTNGLVYHQAIASLPDLDPQEQRLLPLLTYCLPELGAGKYSYLQMQERQSAVTGGISAYWEIKGAIDNEQRCQGYFVLSGKALQRHHHALVELSEEIFNRARFDELDRIRELVALLASRRKHGITNNGHGLAMAAATSNLSPAALVNHRASGLDGISWLLALDSSLVDPLKLKDLATQLQALHNKIISQPIRFLAVAENNQLSAFAGTIASVWQASPFDTPNSLIFPATRQHSKVAWITNSQVSFCAKAYASVPMSHPDASALTVLGHYLRNGFLHRAVREQGGAYGAGAGQDSANAIFRFYSYRDPRIAGTLEDFDASIDWLLSERNQPEAIEQAILGVVSGIDKPRSPAGEAKSAFHNALFGRSPERRRELRSRILKVTLDDLQRVVKTYLKEKPSSIAVVSGESASKTFDELGLKTCRLPA